jgi:AcrR family transcriptional regulator
MPRAFSENEKKLIEQSLIEQGKKQFSVYGLTKTNVEEIAQAAGISKGAFYLFFKSKEELFMKVIEQVEKEFRIEAISLIDRPGATPRIRLTHLLVDLFSLWRTVPILHYFTNTDYQIVLRRMPAQNLKEHFNEDMEFMNSLFNHLNEAGIHIQVRPEIFMQIMYAMFLVALHGDDFGPGGLEPGKGILLEIIAAYALGEISLEAIQLEKLMKAMS